MTATIDARFAGGSIGIETATMTDTGHAVVLLDMPGMNAVPMFPHEARALADALCDAADETEWEAS